MMEGNVKLRYIVRAGSSTEGREGSKYFAGLRVE